MNKVIIDLLEIGDKAKSKSELYKILTVEGALYFPPYKFCSVDFMADIIKGTLNGNSLKPGLFNEYVREMLSSRQKSIKQSKNLSVQTVPKVAELFKSSLMVSKYVAKKGKSNLMLRQARQLEKKSKEMDEVKQKKEQTFDTLKREVDLFKSELD